MHMKKLAMIALTMAAPAVAGSWLQDCCPDLCYNFAVGAEALYWRPCTYQFQYGTRNVDEAALPSVDGVLQSDNKPFVLRPDGNWGFRIFGTVADECNINFANLEWVYVNGSTSDKFNVGDRAINLFPQSVITAENAQGFEVSAPVIVDPNSDFLVRQRTRFNKVSLKFGHRFCGNDCSFLYGYVGARWVDTRVKYFSKATEGEIGLMEDTASVTFDPRIRKSSFKTEFDGGGFEAGLGFHQDVWCGFGVSGRLGLVGLWGARGYWAKYQREATEADPTPATASFVALAEAKLSFADLDKSHCVGGYDMRIGVNYVYECGCWWVKGEIGYEYNHYFNALFAPAASDLSVANAGVATDFGIGGLFFGLTFGF